MAVPVFTARWVGVVESPTDFEEGAPTLYYSKSFLSGHPTVGVVQTIMQIDLRKGADLTAVLRAVQSLPGGEGAFATNARIVSAESRRAVRFQATALWIVTVIVLLGAAILVIQLIARSVRQSEDEKRTLVAQMELAQTLDSRDGKPLVQSPCWAPPVLSHGLLYVRGKDKVVCLELIPE